MPTRRTAPAEARSPDPDRAGPDAPAHIPDWLVHLLVLLRLFAQNWALARGHRSPGLPSWIHDRPDLPVASAQAHAAAVRGSFGAAVAWMCRRRGIGPGHQDWPELSRAIVAFGGSVQGFRPGLPPCGLQWWENPDIVPGLAGMPAPTPAADTMAALLSRQAMADASPPPLLIVLPAAEPAASPPPSRRVLARAATGPPTGPPAHLHQQLCYARTTGPAHGQPRRPDSRRRQAGAVRPMHPPLVRQVMDARPRPMRRRQVSPP